MTDSRNNKRAWFVAAAVLFAAAAAGPIVGATEKPGQAIEWKLKVTTEKAPLRAKPDPDSQVLAELAQGTLISSTQAEGAFLRITLPPGKDGLAVTGYISTNDVEILEESILIPDKEGFPYRGFGLRVCIGGGLTFLPDGDLQTGSQGLFEAGQAFLAGLGFTLEKSIDDPFPLGQSFEFSLQYDITSRFGIEAGVILQSRRKNDSQEFYSVDENMTRTLNMMQSQPDLSVKFLRLGVYAAVPVNKRLHIRFGAAPALALILFEYGRSSLCNALGFEENLLIRAETSRLAFLASIGLEVELNNRTTAFLDVRGRLAKYSKVPASSKYMLKQNGVTPGDVWAEGLLYLVPGVSSLRFGVGSEGTAPAGSRPAVLNLNGVDLAAGVRIRF